MAGVKAGHFCLGGNADAIWKDAGFRLYIFLKRESLNKTLNHHKNQE